MQNPQTSQVSPKAPLPTAVFPQKHLKVANQGKKKHQAGIAKQGRSPLQAKGSWI